MALMWTDQPKPEPKIADILTWDTFGVQEEFDVADFLVCPVCRALLRNKADAVVHRDWHYNREDV